MALFDGRTGLQIPDAGNLPPSLLAILRHYADIRAGVQPAVAKPMPTPNLPPVSTLPEPDPSGGAMPSPSYAAPIVSNPVVTQTPPPAFTGPMDATVPMVTYRSTTPRMGRTVTGYAQPLPYEVSTPESLPPTGRPQMSTGGPTPNQPNEMRPSLGVAGDGSAQPVAWDPTRQPRSNLPRVPSPGIGTASLGYADGGMIRGPGGPRQDNLLIRASSGEVVVPADVVRAKGTEFFDKLKETTRQKAVERHGPMAHHAMARGYADGGVIDESAGLSYLPASGSPGLETLPSEGMPVDESAGLAMPQVSQSAGFAPTPPPATSGVGMADFKAARSEDEAQYLKSLPTAQKIGLMLQSFGAGVNGGPNPIDALLENKRKREQEFRAELGTTVKTIHEGMQVISKMPPGKGRDALIEQITRAAGGQPEVRNALLAVGTEHEAAVRDSVAALDNPRARELLVQMSGGDPEKARQLLKDESVIKLVKERADQETLPLAMEKLRIISRTFEKMPGLNADGKASFTMTDLREQNAKLPKQFQLDEAQINAINRNQAAAITYGLKTDKTAQAEQEATDKRGAQSDIGKARADLAAGRITPDDFAQIMKNKEQRITIQGGQIAEQGRKTTAAESGKFDQQAIDDAAARYRVDGTLPQNMGRGTQGPVNLAAIVNRAADLARESGEGGEAARIRQIAGKANTNALQQVTKQQDLILAFEKNAVKNADLVLQASDKVDRLGVPAIDRWIQAGQKNIAGDVDVAKLDTAIRTFVNEYARVTTTVTGGGITSDTARKEIETLLKGAHTKDQVRGVVDLMKQEMNNRRLGYQEQIKEITGRFGTGKATGEGTPASAPASAAVQPMPTDKTKLVKGQKYQTARGVATWNGSAFEQ